MLQHLRHHKNGIKQTVFAFGLLTIVGGVLFIGANKNFATRATPIDLSRYTYEGITYDLPSIQPAQNQGTNPDAKVKKNKPVQVARPKNLPSFMIKSVVDGNIVVLENNQRVRLAGIKAPERDEEWGMEASDYLKNTIEKKQIYLQLDSRNPEDTFGRLRAIIYIGNKNINIEMLRTGFAQVYVTTPSIIERGDWDIFEKEAVDGKKGLWGEKKVDSNEGKSITERLKNYFFPNTNTNGDAASTPVTPRPVNYDSFLNGTTTDNGTSANTDQNSTANKKPLPAL